MANEGTLRIAANVGGVSADLVISRSADGQIGQNVSLPAGKAGTLSTRTDDDTGEATLSTGHGITTGLVVDVYWEGGVRYNVTVGTVNVNAVPLDGGVGDAFPAEDTAIVVTPQVQIDMTFDGDNVPMVFAHSTQRAHLNFQESDGTVIAAAEIAAAGEGFVWAEDMGIANPLTGDAIAKVLASNGSSSTAATLKLGLLYDS